MSLKQNQDMLKMKSKGFHSYSIEKLKNSPETFFTLLQTESEKIIISILERLGRLENHKIKEPLQTLTKHPNETIRALCLKNLAKLVDFSLLPIFTKHAREDVSTLVRRESTSAIGRLRNEKTIPILIEILNDSDPKVVLQAIRGLLVFSKNPVVQSELHKLSTHPNEQVREILQKELSPKTSFSKDKLKHAEFPSFLKNTVIHSDVLDVLQSVPEESIHLTFTSPPYYNARDYSIYQSYEEYLNFLEVVFREVHRITKEGRFFILNTSPIIIPRVSRKHASKRYPIPYDIHPRLVKIGWEFIDDIVWVKPEASVKNRNAGFLQHRKPLAYKPNAVTEMLMVYRKKTDKLIDWNIKQYNPEKVKQSQVQEDYETTNVWYIDPCFDKVHSAVFPQELCNRVIKFYSFVGDLVFDPFAGSGTLGKAAFFLDRNFFLVEKDSKYFQRIQEEFEKQIDLFNQTNKPRFLNLEEFQRLVRESS
ncbi:MAG: DNA methyltransferase [Leptospiraceae bacterium]|nr:DNA methyltransferase [Leptospiraceae bacterium]